MKYMNDLKDLMCEELEKIAKKGTLSAGDLEAVHKLTDTIKNIDKIDMIEGDSYSRGYANRGGQYGRSYGADYGDSYDSNDSYSDYGYSSRNRRGGRYSRAEGREMVVKQIKEMMDDGSVSESDKGVLARAIGVLMK